MSDEHRRGRLARFVLKIGTVAGAAAALLSEGSTTSRASEGRLDSSGLGQLPAIAAKKDDEIWDDSPPPLILKPSQAGSKIIQVGHRSHSSHSSHSSHVSGASVRSHSSHSSHFSSSVGSGSYRSSGTVSSSSSSPSSSTSSSSSMGSQARKPDSTTAPDTSQAPIPTVTPRPVVIETPPIDYKDPLNRYQLITVGTYGTVQKAFIRDLLVGQPKLIKIGEKIGDSTLMSIANDKKSVRLKPPTGVEFTVKGAR